MAPAGVKRSERLWPAKRWYRTVVAVASVATYVAMAPFGYIAFSLWALIPTKDPIGRAHRLQAIMRRAFTLMHDWLRWIRVLDYDPRKLDGVIPNAPCVVISNHPALDDVTAVMSAIPRLCTAVNRRTFSRRWLQPLLEQSGQFNGHLRSTPGHKGMLESAALRLEQGFRVLVFPEGARSPPGYLRPFGRGAFEIACRVGVPVVPLLIEMEPRWLTRHDTVLAPPAELPAKRIKVLPTMNPADYGGNSREMREHAEAMYSRLLDTPVTRSPHLLARGGPRALPAEQSAGPNGGMN